MLQLDRNVLSVALASAMLLGSTAVQAQSAEDQAARQKDTTATAAADAQQDSENDDQATDVTTTDLDKVTVVGIRRGIESAISVKRESTSIVEAISAEDIGKLPDVSIAESLARLPGLAAQRVAGRAQVISVRGLSPVAHYADLDF